MDFKALLDTKEYGFLRDNPRLGSRVILLGISGSYGYGTNREGDYMQDKTPVPELYEIVTEYERRFHEAQMRCALPDEPDMDAVGTFVESINRRVVMENLSEAPPA